MQYSEKTGIVDYCISTIKDVHNHLGKGYIPHGSAFYHPGKRCCYQPMIKHETLPHLNKREQECLSLLLDGYSRNTIADKISCSLDNVDKLLKKIRGKWKVKTTKELLKKAKPY